MPRVYFDYSLRPWQAQVLRELAGRRFAVVVAHRRAGKTEVMVLRLLLAAMRLNRAHPAPLFGYIAPFLNQARAVAWGRLKHYCRGLPDIRLNETESALTLWNGAIIRLFGADYPDRLRGLGFDGVVLDETAQMKPDTWGAVVRPALSDRRGWAVFIGTPKGRNIFHELYQEARQKEDWFAGLYPADRTGVIPPEETAALRADMPSDLYGQEYLCDFTAANSDSFFDFTPVHEAARREAPIYNPAPLVFGLDVARFGGDRTVLALRRGRVLEDMTIRRGQDLMATAAETAEAINRRRPRAVFVDAAGLGRKFQEAQVQALSDYINARNAELSARPGFREDLALARKTLKEFGSDELSRALQETALGSHPALFDFMAKVGRALGEPGFEGRPGPAAEPPLHERIWGKDGLGAS